MTKHVRIRLDLALRYDKELDSIPDHLGDKAYLAALWKAVAEVTKKHTRRLPISDRPQAQGDYRFEINLDRRPRVAKPPQPRWDGERDRLLRKRRQR